MTNWMTGPPVLVGERILWLGSGSGLPKSGIVKWIGHLPEISHDWTVGIELDEALPYGGIDGTWGNRALFTCESKHGLLVPLSGIIPASQFKYFQHCKGFQQSGQNEKPNTEQMQGVVSEEAQFEESSKQLRPAVRKNTKKGKCQKLCYIQTPSEISNILYEESEYLSDENNSNTLRIEDKDKPEIILQIKKTEIRNVSEVNDGQARRMTSSVNGASFEEAVIDSLYASRHHFSSRGETHSEAAHAFVSISNNRKEKGTSGIFSFFRWFRKEKDDFEENDDIENIRIPSAPTSPRLIRGYGSACGSVDTLFSTATANSFAFVHPELYRPFGNASQPEKFITSGPETDTYRKRLWQRDKIREIDQNISLKKKYNLFGSGTLHRSVDDVYLAHRFNESGKDSNHSPGSKNSTFGRRKKRKAPPPPVVELKPADYSLPNTLEHISKTKTEPSKENNHYNSRERPTHRRTVSDSAKDKKAGAYCHVKGKRKAPPPPIEFPQTEQNNVPVSVGNSSGKKKRPAPPPPIEFLPTNEKKNSCGSLSLEEKLRLLNNIEKLKLHAEQKCTTETEPGKKMASVVSNDSLKLEKGVLKANKAEMQVPEVKQNPASPVSPRPWYKRNIIHKENGKSLEKKKDKSKNNDWMPEVGIPRGSIISTENNRFSNIFSRPDEKRNSQISMLVNISELDREAAEIVRREQEKEKERIAALNSKFYTDTSEPETKQEMTEIENAESPKKSSARELISLFNAIGNVTKVTVNSKFFSKNGPSIFSKEGVEKRFSFINETNEEKVMVQESVVTETVSQSNGNKRETTIIDSRQTYLESPGVKRRRSLLKQDSDENLPSSSASSESFSPKVTIEEIDEFDAERESRTQAMYEANRLRRHHSPSPTIPTIVEMSESVSSAATSIDSTIRKNTEDTTKILSNSGNDNSHIIKDKPITKSITIKVEEKKLNGSNITTVDNAKDSNTHNFNLSHSKDKMASSINKDVISSNIVSNPRLAEHPKLIKTVTIWSCPRCTLENPRWRITCEACDMWRPQLDNIVDNITANFANGVNKKTEKNSEETPDNSQIVKKGSDFVVSDNKLLTEKTANNLGRSSQEKVSSVQTNNQVSKTSFNNIKGGNEFKYPPITNTNLSEIINNKIGSKGSAVGESKNGCSSKIVDSLSHNALGSSSQNIVSENSIQTDTDMDEIRKARIAFFHKSEKEKHNNSTNAVEEVTKVKINNSNDKKNTIATNEEERLKIKEMLKEMKNSLPKRSKDIKSDRVKTESGNSKNDTAVKPELDASKLGAIKKNIPQKLVREKNLKEDRIGLMKNSQSPHKSEMYFVKNEVTIEDIKIKKEVGDKPDKVSTSVQTNGVIRKIEAVPLQNSAAKPPAGRVTPKSSRKEFIVPISVEEYTIKDGVLYTSLSKEHRRIGTGTFELIRPRDFACIEATKAGNENMPVHVYANVPTNNEPLPQVDQTSSVFVNSVANNNTTIDTNDVEKLSAELSRPKGLADFKAGLEGSDNAQVDNNMNTLAVNRILRRLEAAIAGGQHQLAATLAKELARLKINCSVTRHKHLPNTKYITVDMFVEDKVSHQGPIPLQINPSMTVAQLKAKVEREFEIPIQVQRWILGKQLAVNDSITLEQLDVSVAHSPIFLYLVAPAEGSLEKDKSSNNYNLEKTKPDLNALDEAEGKVDTSKAEKPPGKGWYFNDEEDKYSVCDTESESNESSKEPSPEPNKQVKIEIRKQNSEVEVEEVVEEEEEEEEEKEEEVEEEEEEIVEEDQQKEVKINAKITPMLPVNGTLALGWKCPLCTLVNSPTRPGCLACTTMRPAEYNIPQEYQVSKTELERMRLEVKTEKDEAEEKLKHYQQLVNLENSDLVISTEGFDCSICLVNYTGDKGVVLRDCLHTFCRACLAHTVEYSEEAEVKCPYRDDNYACDSTLQDREIKALVTAEVYEQHLAKSVAQAENKIGNAFHCKTPDCRGWCIFEDNVNQFHCPVCNQTNCLTCQAIHKGVNCKQFQEQVHEASETNADARRTREMLEEMVDRGEAMNCPTCQVILMKKWGCDWLRCSMCKTEICWVTRGPRWGPLGKGDTSGGCQCGVNGVKCHPKCNYCH